MAPSAVGPLGPPNFMTNIKVFYFGATIAFGAFALCSTISFSERLLRHAFHQEDVAARLAREVTVADFEAARRRVGFDLRVDGSAKQEIARYAVGDGEDGVIDLLTRLKVEVESVDGKFHRDNPRVDMTSKESSINFFEEPTLNSIEWLANADFDVWLLRQKIFREDDFRSYALVYDKRKAPPTAYYVQVERNGYKWRGGSCYECHVNGPRLIRPLKPALASDQRALETFNAYLATLPAVETHFPISEPRDRGAERLRLQKCDQCHNDVERGAIYSTHAAASAFLVASGEMPIGDTLTAEESYELRRWVESHSKKSWLRAIQEWNVKRDGIVTKLAWGALVLLSFRMMFKEWRRRRREA
jgi:hypothetical protein